MKIPVMAVWNIDTGVFDAKSPRPVINPNNRLITIPIDEWPRLLEQCDIDPTGLNFGKCTYNYATLFEAHYCHAPAIAVQFYDADNWQDGLLRMVIAHRHVCKEHKI